MFLLTSIAAGRRRAPTLASRVHQRVGNQSCNHSHNKNRVSGCQQQWQQFSSKNSNSNARVSTSTSTGRKTSKKVAAPLPPPLPSPSKAKQEYLKTVRKHDTSIGNTAKTTEDIFLQNPQAKVNQLTQELEVVRDQAAAKLDAEINKSVWRKLTDPLRRYKHSMINIGAMSLAYMLAYMLFVKSKSEKEARRLLEQTRNDHRELQTALQSLLESNALRKMAQACVEEMQLLQDETLEERQTTPMRSSWFFGGVARTSRRGRQQQERKEQQLVERLQEALQQHLTRRIGESAMTEEQRQQKSMQDIWKESQSQVKALNENPEQVLLQAIFEEEAEKQETTVTSPSSGDTDDSASKKKQPRRVFSM